jgi:hypothetical protein
MPPKAFNTVDVVTTLGKFILTVIDTKVLAITNIGPLGLKLRRTLLLNL